MRNSTLFPSAGIVDVNSWNTYSSFERRMSREVWADYTVQTPLWSATLSSRQRVLLHAQPILAMRQELLSNPVDGWVESGGGLGEAEAILERDALQDVG